MVGRAVGRVVDRVVEWRSPGASVPLAAFALGRALQVVLVAVAVVAVVRGVLRPLLGPLGVGVGAGRFWGESPLVEASLASTVAVSSDPPLPLLVSGPYGPGDAVDFYASGVSLQFWSPDLPQRLLLVAVPVLTAVLVLGVLVQLIGLAGALAAGDPMARRSQVRLRTIALLVGVAGQSLAIGAAVARWWVLSDDRLAPWVAPNAPVSLVPAAVGGAVAVMAYAVGIGAPDADQPARRSPELEVDRH